MDLSNSQSNHSQNDFINLMNPGEDHQVTGGGDKKEEILPNYDFQPIRPVGSSSPKSKVDSSNVTAHRGWNSADNKSNSSSVRVISISLSLSQCSVLHEYLLELGCLGF